MNALSALWTLGAEADVQDIYARFEDWEEGSGDRFYDDLLTSVRLLEAFPLIGPIVYADKVRRVLVFNRHYGLFYVVEARGIILHALLDLRQDPSQLLRRIQHL
jgi:plasmid stabilization system protein ParE